MDGPLPHWPTLTPTHKNQIKLEEADLKKLRDGKYSFQINSYVTHTNRSLLGVTGIDSYKVNLSNIFL